MDDFSNILNNSGMNNVFSPYKLTMFDRIKRKLFIPFLICVIALALWALSKALVAMPDVIEQIIPNIPNGLLKNVLIWIHDTSGPALHYTSKLFDWILPTAQKLWNAFVELAQHYFNMFLNWVDSL